MTTVLQRNPSDLKSAIETMFRIRAVESPPDEQGSRTIWHRGAKGADLVTFVDADGKVSRQELYLFEDFFHWERAAGLKTGVALDKVGSAAARATGDIAYDQDAVLRGKRLENAARALAHYDGQDKLIGHVREVINVAAKGGDFEGAGTVTRSANTVRLEEMKAASQELHKRELDARLASLRRNMWLLIGGVLVAAAGITWWWVNR